MYQPATAQEFVKAWQESSSIGEVAAKVRAKKNACRVRAYRYRKMGVPLKAFPPPDVEVMGWDDLAKYASEVLKGGRRHEKD
jgi:hypothetical protein